MKMPVKEKRDEVTSEAAWSSRKEMTEQGLLFSIPWFALANICFSLMIYFRNALFEQIDEQYSVAQNIARDMDYSMLGVCLLSAGIVAAVWRQFPVLSLLLAGLSLLWAVCGFYFIAYWHLPFAWPLCSILILTALSALYFYPLGLLSFQLPLWLMLPLASVYLNQGINIRFISVWLIFTLIVVCGYFVLRRWFDEAWLRNQQNKLLIARLDTLAHQDPLTGTANRRALEQFLNEATLQNKKYAVLMTDVDYFKRYNDVYGHQAGDHCLARVAAALKKGVRTPDDIVFRYGGEEFAIVLFNASENDSQTVARRIQQMLVEEKIMHEASSVSRFVTVSIGIATSTSENNAHQTLVAADAALYRAKEKGRNCWSF